MVRDQNQVTYTNPDTHFGKHINTSFGICLFCQILVLKTEKEGIPTGVLGRASTCGNRTNDTIAC